MKLLQSTFPLKQWLHLDLLLPSYLLLLCLQLLLHPITQAYAQEPKAADLVTDGQVIDITQEKYRQLFAELVQEHGFSQEELTNFFSGTELKRQVLVLMDKQWEAKPYYQYYPNFITKSTIATGKKMLRRHRELLTRVEEAYGVDRHIVIAIWGIETRFGANQGKLSVFQTLNTLFDAYPRRSAFFRQELIAFLLLCRDNGMAPKDIKGSYAGAFGQTQFIPSSYRKYAVSFDGNSQADVWRSIPDILASIASYLHSFGWVYQSPMYADIGFTLNDPQLVAAHLKGRKGRVPVATIRATQKVDIPDSPENRTLSIVGLELPPGDSHPIRYIAGYPNFQAITEWNHSNRYAMAVTQFAEALAR